MAKLSARPSRGGGGAITFTAVRVVVTLAVTLVISQFYRTTLAAIAPELMHELHLSAGELGVASSAFFLAFAAMQIPVGMLLDRFGPRRTVPSLLVLAVTGAVVVARSDGFALLTIGQVLLGAGCSGIFMGGLVSVARWFPADRFATVAAAVVAFSNTGGLLSATPFSAVVEAIGWRASFLALAGVTAFLALAIVALVRDAPPGHPFHERPPEGLGGALRGVREVLTNRRIWPLLAMSFVSYPAILAVRSVWAGPFVHDVYGLDGVARGNVLLLISVAMIAGLLAYGPLDRVFDTRKRIIVWGTLATIPTLVILAAVPHLEPWQATALLVLFAFLGSNYVQIQPHGKAFFHERLVGRVMTALNLASFTGIATFQAVTGFILGAFPVSEAGTYPPEAYRAMFAFLAVVSALALFAYARSKDVRPSTERGGPDSR